jgi:large subunit ribosomal protein L17
MRHGKKFNHLSRTDSHRKALLSSLATSLIVHKRITTTVAKAKALRIYVEPLLTKSKLDSTHSRRTVFSYLQDKNSVNILFRDVASKIAERPGGYTRIIKTGTRLGDNAEMCFIELVDYNEIYTAKAEVKKAKTTRRGRSGSSVAKDKVSDKEVVPPVSAEPVALAPEAPVTAVEDHMETPSDNSVAGTAPETKEEKKEDPSEEKE